MCNNRIGTHNTIRSDFNIRSKFTARTQVCIVPNFDPSTLLSLCNSNLLAYCHILPNLSRMSYNNTIQTMH